MSTATAVNPWKKKVASSEGGDFELPPGGSYPAEMVGLIDLGTSDSTYNNETSKRHKILFIWELTAEHDSKGESFKVAKDFTFSLGAKSKLRPFLEGWLARKFGDDEEIDVSAFLGMQCVLNLAEDVSKKGKKFVEVTSAVRPMKGLTVPPSGVQQFMWDFTTVNDKGETIPWDPRKEPPIPEWVPFLYGRKVADDIKASDEWSKLTPF